MRRADVTKLAGAVVLAMAVVLPAGGGSDTEAAQAKGRYKKEGNSCVWDASDSGPNQCTPRVEGRFRKSGDACVWDARDRGADQCTPSKGRFKVEGERCVWNAEDSGPNQCNPRQPR